MNTPKSKCCEAKVKVGLRFEGNPDATLYRCSKCKKPCTTVPEREEYKCYKCGRTSTVVDFKLGENCPFCNPPSVKQEHEMSPAEVVENSPQKKAIDTLYNQIQDNIALSSKVPFITEKQEAEGWSIEFVRAKKMLLKKARTLDYADRTEYDEAIEIVEQLEKRLKPIISQTRKEAEEKGRAKAYLDVADIFNRYYMNTKKISVLNLLDALRIEVLASLTPNKKV